MKVIPFIAAHLDLIELRDSEQERLDLDPRARTKMEALAQHGEGGTLFHDGRVIAIIGYYEMWPGVFEVWAFPSIYVHQYATIYVRTVKRYIDGIERTFTPHRIQTMSVSDEQHDAWMRLLGFTCEGVLSQYSVNRQDYKAWAKIYGRTTGDGISGG